MIKNKKAQEEIVGFVAIVILVTIVGVIFLGISLRQGGLDRAQESKDVYQFLDSVMQYTSDCAISYEPNYLRLSELIQECHTGAGKCLSGESPCEVVNKSLVRIIEASFKPNKEGNIKGYEFKTIYSRDNATEEVLLIKNGNCSNSLRGSEILTPAFPGTLANSLEICY